jgi:hypothetical protein
MNSPMKRHDTNALNDSPTFQPPPYMSEVSGKSYPAADSMVDHLLESFKSKLVEK